MRSDYTKREILNQILSQEFQNRFWDNVEIAGPDQCWNWTASRSATVNGHLGYGQVNIWNSDLSSQHHLTSNQIVLMFSTREIIPAGFQALHTCVGNRGCCNPNHIYAGTPRNNVDDRINQGRGKNGITVGEIHWKAKFSVEDILAIREKYRKTLFTQQELAEMYGTKRRYIWKIINRKAWSHI